MNILIGLKRKIVNVYKMLKYGYLNDRNIKASIVYYGKNKKQNYKVYNSNDSTKPTIVFVHGGGWKQGSPSLYSGVGKFFCKNGYTTVIIGYRLVPKYHYPTQIEDAFIAFNHYLKESSNIKDIIIAGYSAGGEIASHLAFDVRRLKTYNIDRKIIKGFISISGVLNFSQCKSRYSKKLIQNYLLKRPIEDANPINLLSSTNTLPTLCIHGDKDSIISVDNSITFINKLKSFTLNRNINIKIIKNASHEHTIDIVRGPGNEYSKYVFDFIEKTKKSTIYPQ